MSSAIQPGPSEALVEDLAAIVLAAGFSSRMDVFKPLLPLAGATAFERCIGLFRSAGVTEVIVVLGHREDELRPLAERCGARSVSNPRFERGMFSSLVAGSLALPSRTRGAFVLPVDIPLVRPATVRQLVATFGTQKSGIVYPSFAGRRGHPPLIARPILDEAAREGESGTLCSLLARYESSAVESGVADEAIHMDMDTPADYADLLALAARRDLPTVAECEAILAGQHVEERVVRHARKVAEVAHRVALALVRSGLELNLELVRAGALLHDLAKGQRDHAHAGASLLRAMDYPKVAEVVAAHTDLCFPPKLDESAIVYLADKLVRGGALVTIDERFRLAFDRFHDDPVALHAVQRRKSIALEVILAAESRLGAPLSSAIEADSGSILQPFGALIADKVKKQ